MTPTRDEIISLLIEQITDLDEWSGEAQCAADAVMARFSPVSQRLLAAADREAPDGCARCSVLGLDGCGLCAPAVPDDQEETT